jgi:hypothetical protein
MADPKVLKGFSITFLVLGMLIAVIAVIAKTYGEMKGAMASSIASQVVPESMEIGSTGESEGEVATGGFGFGLASIVGMSSGVFKGLIIFSAILLFLSAVLMIASKDKEGGVSASDVMQLLVVILAVFSMFFIIWKMDDVRSLLPPVIAIMFIVFFTVIGIVA